jgi:hypothetical protein
MFPVLKSLGEASYGTIPNVFAFRKLGWSIVLYDSECFCIPKAWLEHRAPTVHPLAGSPWLHDRICTLTYFYGKPKPEGVEGLMAPPLLSRDDLVKQAGAFIREVVPTSSVVLSQYDHAVAKAGGMQS